MPEVLIFLAAMFVFGSLTVTILFAIYAIKIFIEINNLREDDHDER